MKALAAWYCPACKERNPNLKMTNNNFRMVAKQKPLFNKMKFMLCGRLSQTQKQLSNLIRKHGGVVVDKLTSAVSCVVVRSDLPDVSAVMATANSLLVPVIHESFIHTSIKCNRREIISDYVADGSSAANQGIHAVSVQQLASMFATVCENYSYVLMFTLCCQCVTDCVTICCVGIGILVITELKLKEIVIPDVVVVASKAFDITEFVHFVKQQIMLCQGTVQLSLVDNYQLEAAQQVIELFVVELPHFNINTDDCLCQWIKLKRLIFKLVVNGKLMQNVDNFKKRNKMAFWDAGLEVIRLLHICRELHAGISQICAVLTWVFTWAPNEACVEPSGNSYGKQSDGKGQIERNYLMEKVFVYHNSPAFGEQMTAYRRWAVETLKNSQSPLFSDKRMRADHKLSKTLDKLAAKTTLLYSGQTATYSDYLPLDLTKQSTQQQQ